MNDKERFYYRFYFLKGNIDTPTIYETLDEFNIVCKSFPYNIMGKAKPLPTLSYPDEDGVEVFLPKTGSLPLEPQTIDVEFVCCSNDARADMLKFRDFLVGRDGSGVQLGIYDSYTGLSADMVLYQDFKPDAHQINLDTNDVVVFKVTFLLTKGMSLNRVIKPLNGDFNDDFNDDYRREYIYLNV